MHPVSLPLLPERFGGPKLIGEGAVGAVYETWDDVRGERVALKTLHKATAEAIREFKSEFRTLAAVSHENLVVLHELFFERGVWCFTMELVRGQPLIDGLTPGDRRSDEALRSRFLQLARGVCALHEVGILHRDIKPPNALAEAGGRVVLLDFGMVTELNAGRASPEPCFELVGSPGYMAPEVM